MMAWCALLRLCLPSVPGVELQGRWLMSGKSWLTLFSPALWPLFLHMDNISSFSSRRHKKKKKAKQTPQPLFKETRAAAHSDGIYFVLSNSIHLGSGCGQES